MSRIEDRLAFLIRATAPVAAASPPAVWAVLVGVEGAERGYISHVDDPGLPFFTADRSEADRVAAAKGGHVVPAEELVERFRACAAGLQ